MVAFCWWKLVIWVPAHGLEKWGWVLMLCGSLKSFEEPHLSSEWILCNLHSTNNSLTSLLMSSRAALNPQNHRICFDFLFITEKINTNYYIIRTSSFGSWSVIHIADRHAQLDNKCGAFTLQRTFIHFITFTCSWIMRILCRTIQ